MKSYRNEDIDRKSSVYNQTGQTYFEQLTAYNRTSSHLRRLLLAPSVVDSRNTKYTRRERENRQRQQHQRLSSNECCCRSSYLERIQQSRTNLIEGLAYDTKHHPIDSLRMTLKYNSRSLGKEKRALNKARNVEAFKLVIGEAKRPIDKFPRENKCCYIRHDNLRSLGSQTPRFSADYAELIGSSHARQYDSDSPESDTPPAVNKSVDARDNKSSRRLERQEEEAKYAKFIYEITREIMVNGLYTDEQIQAIFDKHLEMNSELLNKDKMQSEIRQLRRSLNLKEPSINEMNERLDEIRRNKLEEKIRGARAEATRFGKNDGNPDEYLIAEREMILSLMEMELDSRRLETIGKSGSIARSKTWEDRANSPIIWKSEGSNVDNQDSRLLRKSENYRTRIDEDKQNKEMEKKISLNRSESYSPDFSESSEESRVTTEAGEKTDTEGKTTKSTSANSLNRSAKINVAPELLQLFEADQIKDAKKSEISVTTVNGNIKLVDSSPGREEGSKIQESDDDEEINTENSQSIEESFEPIEQTPRSNEEATIITESIDGDFDPN